MYCLNLDRGRHWLPPEPTELDELLRREFPDLALFTYWHLHTQRWTIAEWLSKDKGRAVEIMALDRGLPFFRDRAQFMEFRERLFRPQTAYEMKKILELDEKRRQDKWNDCGAEMAEEKARLIYDNTPGKISRPQVSLFVPGRLQ